MPSEDDHKMGEAEALKDLRKARKHTIAAATAKMKAQKKDLAAIKEELQQGARTVPELASATGLPASEVLWYVATLKKYGEVLEGPQVGSYFSYRLVQAEPAQQEPDLDD